MSQSRHRQLPLGRTAVFCSDIVSQMSSTRLPMGSYEQASIRGVLLPRLLPGDTGRNILWRKSRSAGRTMWDKLGNVNESVLANYLKTEYPQTRRRGAARRSSLNTARALFGRPARGIRARSRAAQCSAWNRLEGYPRQGRADAARECMVDARAHPEARRT